jgi:hypothetical protein
MTPLSILTLISVISHQKRRKDTIKCPQVLALFSRFKQKKAVFYPK